MKTTEQKKAGNSMVFDTIEDIISSCGGAGVIADHLDELMLGYIEAGATTRKAMDNYLWDIVYTVTLLKNGFIKFGELIKFESKDENKRQ